MAIREISSYHLGDMLLVFEEETEFHRVGFYMIPWSMQKDRVLDRKFYRINSLAQVKIKDAYLPMFLQTVIMTLVGTILCLILVMLFPGIV